MTRLLRQLSRALRVLLTCLALVTAMPSAVAAPRDEVPSSIAVFEQRAALARMTCVSAKRACHHDSPSQFARVGRVHTAPFAIAQHVHARRVFLLNCSWLC